MRRLTFVIPSLSQGGAERVLSRLASHFAEHDDHVTVVTLSSPDSDTYPLSPAVHRVALGLQGESSGPLQRLTAALRRIRKLRAAVLQARPQIVLSFIDTMNVLTVFACRGTRIPVVCCERTDPRFHRLSRLWAALRRHAYTRCHSIVVPTQPLERVLRPQFPGQHVVAIPNAAPTPPAAPAAAPEPHPYLLGVGRLSYEKGFDRLIEAFALLAARFPQHSLVILGEGQERSALEQRCQALGLSERVIFRSWEPDPYPWYQHADVFALTSRYEGFPNALLEAMSCGTPVVAMSRESGAGEIVRHEVDGLLLNQETPEALAAALTRLLQDSDLRNRLGDAARQVAQRFRVQETIERWDTLIDTCLRETGRRVHDSAG